MTSRGFGMVWGDPGRFASFMAEDDAKMGNVMKGVGLAKT